MKKNKNLIKIKDKYPVDIVYTWVDGSDVNWINNKNKVLNKYKLPITTNGQTKNRFENHNELKYSLRSIEMYMPWVRKIFIVTDNQKPKWLILNNKKIVLIDHKQILPQYIKKPTYNSTIIELFLDKIPNLSEKFIYFNDDFIVNKPLEYNDFFTKDNKIVCFGGGVIENFPELQLFDKLSNNNKLSFSNIFNEFSKRNLEWLSFYLNSYDLFQLTNKIQINSAFYLKHAAYTFTKQSYSAIFKKYLPYIKLIKNNQFRSTTDIFPSLLFYLEMSLQKKLYISNKEYDNFEYGLGTSLINQKKEDIFEVWNDKYKFISIADNEETKKDWMDLTKKILNMRFFKKSSFEVFKKNDNFLLKYSDVFIEFKKYLKNQTLQIEEKDNVLKNQTLQIEEKDNVLKNQTLQIEEKDNVLKNQTLQIEEKDKIIISQQKYIDKIKNSNFWKVANKYYFLRDLFLKKIKKILEILNQIYKNGAKKSIEKIFYKSKHIINNNYNPYSHLKLLKDIEVIITNVSFSKQDVDINFSTVTPVFNESDRIIDFLRSLKSQTIYPKEFVIVDTGSTDDTKYKIKNFTKLNKNIPIHLIESPIRIGISEGRNLGVKNTTSQNIMFLDAGNIFDKNFCLNLVGIFAKDKKADIGAPIALPVKKNKWTYQFLVDWENMNWINTYLPAARGLLVKKRIFNKIGGFAEYLKWSGEDTYFDIQYRRYSKKWVINRAAKCYWFGPSSLEKVAKVHKRYGEGDGLNGVGDFIFYPRYKNWKEYQIFPSKIFFENKFNGYIDGLEKRPEIEKFSRGIKKINVVLSDGSFTELDGNNLATKKSISLINKKEKVFFINIHNDLEKNKQIFFNIDYSLLELFEISRFSQKDFLKKYSDTNVYVYVFSKNKKDINNFLRKFNDRNIKIIKHN